MKSNEDEMTGILLTDQEVASIFRVTRATIWNWVKAEGAFPAPRKYNGATRWIAREIADYIEQGGRNDDR